MPNRVAHVENKRRSDARHLSSLSVAALVPLFFWTPPLSATNGSTPEAAAMTRLKIKALKLGADAVLSASCVHHEIVDGGNDCFESWICTGEAVQTR